MSKVNVNGGVKVTSNTSMEPTKTISVPVKVHIVNSTINAGFQQEWLSGEHDGLEFEISAGAGLGSRYGVIRVGDVNLIFDAAQFLGDVIEMVIGGKEES